MEKQKVLIVHNYYQISGGEETVIANEKRLLEEHGHVVEMYTRHNRELGKMPWFQKLFLPLVVIFNYRTYQEIKKLIKEKQIDIVHVHNTLTLISPAVYYAADKCKVPVVQTIHNFRLLCPKATFYRDGAICEDCLKQNLWCAVKHKCYRKSRLQTFACVISTLIHRTTGIYEKINYICLTEFTKNKLLQLKQINEEKVFVKPNFTYDCGRRSEWNEHYLFVGRVEEIKGVDLLVEAFKQMPNRKLKIIGSGEFDEKISARLRIENIKNVEMLGVLPHERVQEYMQSAKGLIMCSQCYEAFAMVIVEAFSAGAPAIVGDIGNIKGLVEPGKTGERFIYNSYKSLIEAIDRFETGDMEAYRKNVYDFYKENFMPEMNYKLLLEIYIKIKGEI